ncbi:MAG: P-II family nitrogen regulator [Desulfomonile tiedjei]|uniref:P-II family nitrogen regulator n=1 Tax=Desulfomonile tiedjei TaxID=2358 RepID=A0A9D6V253_9BACT|nr:P-II family nitrogen regulator [Desulfomonile tiedjei]
MVLIEAIIKPFKLDDVKDALEELGAGGMTFTEVLHSGQPRHKGRSFGDTSRDVDLAPKIKVEIAVPDHLAERIVEAICVHGTAGRNEDGKIIVQELNGAVRIRTGELDADALS